MNSAKERARNVFPTPVGPKKTKDPIGRRGSFRSARDRLKALLMAITASSWPMTRSFQLLLHFEEFLRFFLFHAVQRHPGPLGHDVHDILARDDDFVLIALFPPLI